MKNNQHKLLLVVVCLILLWNIADWLIVSSFYLARKKEVIEQRTALAQEQASDLANSIKRNLNYLHGIPDVLSQFLRVKKAAIQFGANRTPSSLPLKERKKRWTEDRELNDLSRYFALAKASLNVDIIYLINAGGDCIAASNWDTPGSTIGTNFVDRDFYIKNINGQHGMQYAVGKTTNIPGLYFSSPVIIDGRFLGAVVAKTDVPNLSFLINELDAFVTDDNDIIILARDKSLEMLAHSDAIISRMPEQKSFARYRRNNFPVLKMEPWGEKEFSSLVRVQGKDVPHVFFSNNIPEYGLTVYAGEEINDIRMLDKDESWFSFLLGISGSVLVLIVGGAVLYWNSIKSAKIALDRADAAERKIISISEDTQQRIGQELHDDLGQLLTGVAFMSEVLYKKLKNQGRAEIQEASKITALINEAVSKTRNLAQGLYPVELREAGLPAMLERLANRTEEIYKIECVFTGDMKRGLDNDIAAINLYRIAQEAVNNAVKHSGATKITLELKSRPSVTTLEIADNGCGVGNLTGAEAKDGLGMHSMQYRASLLGAALRIGTPPGGGTSVAISLPA